MTQNKSNEDLSSTALRVLLVDNDVQRSESVEHALREQGHEVICLLESALGLLRQVDDLKPDVIIIDIDSPDRDILESVSTLSQINPLPVVMLAEESNSALMKQAIESGVSAYSSEAVEPQRLQMLLEMASLQFTQYQSLKKELDSTRLQLESRKWIERAKGLIMQQHNLTENQAFAAMRKMAMDRSQKLEDVAKIVISMFEAIEK